MKGHERDVEMSYSQSNLCFPTIPVFSLGTAAVMRKASVTSNSLEKVLELCSSMTCFTNCFTVSGS